MRQALQDRAGQPREVIEQRVEAAAVEHLEFQIGRGDDGRGPGDGVEQRHLTEVVAGADRRDGHAVLHDLGRAGDDQRELLSQVALGHHRASRCDRHLVGEPVDLAEFLRGAAGEQRQGADPFVTIGLGVHSVTLPGVHFRARA